MIPDIAHASGLAYHYYNSSGTDDWNDQSLESEKVLKFVRRRQQDWKLNAEEDEMSYQFVRRDAGALGQAVGYVQEAWPDSSDDLEHSGTSGP